MLPRWGAKRKRSSRGPRKWAGPPAKRNRDMAAVSKLKSAVTTMKRQLNTTTQRLYYRTGGLDLACTSLGGNAGLYQQMLYFSNWVPTFGTDADDAAGKQCVVKSIDLDWSLTAFNEKAYVDATVYVLRLKEEAAGDILANGNFASSSWPVQDLDMSYYPASALSERPGLSGGFFNPKKYQVLYEKRCVINASGGVPNTATGTGVVSTSVTTSKNTYRGRKRLTFGQGLKIRNAAADWKATLRPLDTRNNVYFVVVCNDFSGDGENPLVSWNALVKIDA